MISEATKVAKIDREIKMCSEELTTLRLGFRSCLGVAYPELSFLLSDYVVTPEQERFETDFKSILFDDNPENKCGRLMVNLKIDAMETMSFVFRCFHERVMNDKVYAENLKDLDYISQLRGFTTERKYIDAHALWIFIVRNENTKKNLYFSFEQPDGSHLDVIYSNSLAPFRRNDGSLKSWDELVDATEAKQHGKIYEEIEPIISETISSLFKNPGIEKYILPSNPVLVKKCIVDCIIAKAKAN